MIKLIAVDLDGTLLNSQHEMTEKTEKALKAAIAQGVKVVLATGKTRHSAEGIIKRLNLTTPGVYLQGLSVHYPDNSVRHQLTLTPDVLRRVITFAEDRGFDVVAYSGTRIMIRAASASATELTVDYGEPAPDVVGPLQNIVDNTQINKIIVVKRNDARKITALRWQLSMQLDAKKEARLTQALPDMLEILPPGASKGNGLKTLLKELDVKPEEVLAIGDGENDIEMIQLAGIGVAVGNASEKLKAIADYVVASNDEDGVAEAVERFAIKKPEPTPESLATATSDTTVSDEAKADVATETTTAAATELLKSDTATESPVTKTEVKAE
ncbi:MAG TPA: Cof-type HAD-IIB family hydrolase [Phototrophicaceae bacterium]|nr:Cof-type HAD-IIB family hydrolase [Phototrophicaceae bacterium]